MVRSSCNYCDWRCLLGLVITHLTMWSSPFGLRHDVNSQMVRSRCDYWGQCSLLGLVVTVEVAFGAVDLTIWKGGHGGGPGRGAGPRRRPRLKVGHRPHLVRQVHQRVAVPREGRLPSQGAQSIGQAIA